MHDLESNMIRTRSRLQNRITPGFTNVTFTELKKPGCGDYDE